jgi:predicted phosphate transport protein (TIGR00153 family)
MKVSSAILNVFVRSPLRPLQEHMSKVHSCVETLLLFFTATQDSQWANAEQYQHKIASLEQEADELKKNLKLNLPSTLLLPVNRIDLLEMINLQDRLANKAQDISTLVLSRQLHFPETLGANVLTYLQHSILASQQANDAIHELDNLLETGFFGNEVKLVDNMLEKLDLIENDTKELQAIIRHELFVMEKNLPPIDVMFMYKIIERIGDMADCAQAVGEQFQLMLAG